MKPVIRIFGEAFLYSCAFDKSYTYEKFVPELVLAYQISESFLFDFSDPHKLNLEEFMLKNFHYNAPIEHFAKLSGRSLTSFKREFSDIFKTSPGPG
jgi:hypothetical protein